LAKKWSPDKTSDGKPISEKDQNDCKKERDKIQARDAKILASLSSALEIYDPDSQDVYYVGNLSAPRSQAATAMLRESDAFILVGGMGGNHAPWSSEVITYKGKSNFKSPSMR
jgi:hypothetical protein